jgi:plastocyanin
VNQRTQCYPRAVKSAPVALALLSFAALQGFAATLEITVNDARGAPVADAVISVSPRPGPAPVRKREAAIEQRDKAFVPLVTVVQAGTAVQFPNRDPIRHHVYSFSPPKTFEIKLYAGTPVAPVVFDKTGEVVLGCNIHDPMIAYIYVVDTPWFAKTGTDGKARIEGLPPGDYEMQLVHYAQVAAQPAVPLKVRAEESLAAPFVLPLRQMPPRPAAQ